MCFSFRTFGNILFGRLATFARTLEKFAGTRPWDLFVAHRAAEGPRREAPSPPAFRRHGAARPAPPAPLGSRSTWPAKKDLVGILVSSAAAADEKSIAAADEKCSFQRDGRGWKIVVWSLVVGGIVVPFAPNITLWATNPKDQIKSRSLSNMSKRKEQSKENMSIWVKLCETLAIFWGTLANIWRTFG